MASTSASDPRDSKTAAGDAVAQSPLLVGVFSLAMMNVVAVASLRDLPQMATYGLGAIFFYTAAALFFFIPVSLVAAGMGIVGSLFCIVIGYFPLDHFATDAINPRAFVIFLAVGMTSFCLLPLVLARLRRRRR